MASYDADTKAKALALAETMPLREVAARLGVPEGTIKRWRHEARTQQGKRVRANRARRTAKAMSRSAEPKAPDNRPQRDERGRWLPGVSGNPSGSTSAAQIARRMAEKASPELIELLLSIAHDTKQKIYARLEAIKELLDRGLGKPTQAVTLDARTEHRYVYELTQRIVADPDAARLADELLGRVAGDPGRVRLDRVRRALDASEAPAPAESVSG